MEWRASVLGKRLIISVANIVFVNDDDVIIGAGSRLEAIRRGIAHRIVRILLFNSKGELLIQKRSPHVVSLPGRWDQSTAGHVEEGEGYFEAAIRELKEEIGVVGVHLIEQFKYFSVETDEELPKRRFNMIYTATFDGPVAFDQMEVSAVQWITPAALRAWMRREPAAFTQGFITCHERYFI